MEQHLGLTSIDSSKLPEGVEPTGVRVRDVDLVNIEAFKKAHPEQQNVGLQKNDVVLAINNIDVGKNGTVPLRWGDPWG